MEDEAQAAEAAQEPAEVETTEAPTADDFAKMQAALKKANAEAAERRIKLQEYEKADADRKAAEMTEIEKAQAEAEKLRAELLSTQKQTIAIKAGLPAEFSGRLQGDTLEEIEADALKLAEHFAKPAQPKPTKTSAAAPAAKTPLTSAAIAKMTPQEINANWEAVQAALKDS